MEVFLCLLKADLYTPVNLILSERDIDTVEKTQKGQNLTLQDDVMLTPEFIQPNGIDGLLLPIFSSKEEGFKYEGHHSWKK